MKKIMFFLITMSLVLFNSCSDDDSTELSVKNSDVTGGTWYVISMKEDGAWKDYSSLNMRMTFKSDSTFIFIGNALLGDYYYVGTWVLNNNVITATTVDDVIETYRFISMSGSDAEIQYSNDYNWKTPTNIKVKKK